MPRVLPLAAALLALIAVRPVTAADTPSCPQMRTCAELISISEKTNLNSCLAGKSIEVGVSLKASLDIIKRAIGGDFKANFDDATKASSKFNDELQRPENDEIRTCLGDFRSLVNKCMARAQDQCLSQNDYPTGVDFLFQMAFKEKNSDLFLGDKVALGYRQPNRYRNPTYHDPDATGWYSGRLDMRAPDGKFEAEVTRVPKNAFDPLLKGHMLETPICLQWAERAPPGKPEEVAFYSCAEADAGGSCTQHPKDLKWLRRCAPDSKSGSLWPSLIGTAHAQTGSLPGWVVPSLETLNVWRETYVVGFTQFAIKGVGTAGIDADSVSWRIFVNGRELLIDGLPAEYRGQDFIPGSPVSAAFGVQTLNMDGRIGGCDRLEIEFLYRKGREQVAAHRLAANVAAMRKPDAITRVVGDTAYQWTGAYTRPQKEPETEVLVLSTDPSDFVPERLATMRGRIESAKRAFDAVKLNFAGNRMVGVIRPPLTNGAFGLAAGVVEPTGQVRFVFSLDEARKLQNFLSAARSQPAVARIVVPDTLLYSANKNRDRENVCPAV